MTSAGGADLVRRLMGAWTQLPVSDEEATAAFGEVYTSPVLVNGVPFTLAQLVARARALHRAFTGLGQDLVDVVDAPGKLVVVFRMRGVHSGPLQTPLGEVPATGRPIDVRTIDVLTLTDGRVSEVNVLSDELGMLTGLGAITLAQRQPEERRA